MAQQVHRPHERLAVGDREVGGEDGLAQLRVLLGLHHRVDGRDADVGVLAGRDGGVDPVERPRVVRERQRDAEHLLRSEGRHGPDGGRGGQRHVHRMLQRSAGLIVAATW